MIPGDTTEEPSAGSDAEVKPVCGNDVAADNEVTFMSVPSTLVAEVADDAPMAMECVLPPSPPMDNSLVSALLSDKQPPTSDVSDVDNHPLQQSSSDEDSAGYASCSSSMIANTDETPDDVSSTTQQPALSAASKYRLRCQCGAKNCRGYLYS